MKKFVLISLILLFLLTSFGCSNNTPADSSSQEKTETQTNEIPDTPQDTVSDESESTQSSIDSAQNQSEQGFTSLEIEISEGALYIRSGSTLSIESHNGQDMDYEISNGTLYFSQKLTGDVVLTLPENDDYETFKLNVKNGHAYVESALTVDHLDFKVDQGEASIDNICVSDDSSIKIVDGSASVYGDPGASVTASCQQGSLNLAITLKEEDYNYNIDLSGGNLQLDHNHYNGKSYSTTVDNNAARSMDLNCTHGDLSVNFK